MNEEQTARIRMLEEARTLAIDTMPALWHGLYQRCVMEGFSATQALILVQTFILSQCPYGVHGAGQ